MAPAIAFFPGRAGSVFPTWGRFRAATRWKAVTLLGPLPAWQRHGCRAGGPVGARPAHHRRLILARRHALPDERADSAPSARVPILLFADCLFWTVYTMLFASGWLEFFIL
ncbi:MAG: hypothetical protein IPJ98_14340 [Bryobacterales bacterium]|nr:hypothetical protein [Bryobacterales bacterium]